MPERLITMASLLERICLSKTQLYRKINQGDFPRPVPIGRQRIAFLESEVEEWIASRIAARDRGDFAQQRRARSFQAIALANKSDRRP
jgi:prophage regulatory protein